MGAEEGALSLGFSLVTPYTVRPPACCFPSVSPQLLSSKLGAITCRPHRLVMGSWKKAKLGRAPVGLQGWVGKVRESGARESSRRHRRLQRPRWAFAYRVLTPHPSSSRDRRLMLGSRTGHSLLPPPLSSPPSPHVISLETHLVCPNVPASSHS